MRFKTFNELVKKVNVDLGPFCNEFQYMRKELTGQAKTAGNNEIFGNISNEGWAINKGGGIEIQYHIAFYPDDLSIVYGFGFNTQYVPFKNELSSVDYMRPYINAFLRLESTIKEQLPDYDYIGGTREQLLDPKDNQYTLIGKKIIINKVADEYEVSDDVFLELLGDLKRQFKPYQQIFKLRNELITMTKATDDYKQILEFKKQLILQGPPGTGKTYTAKDIAESMIFGKVSDDKKQQKKDLELSEQFKLIQFHPSYSYEDFVRGITVKSNGTQVEYSTQDRVLGKFAREALINYEDSKKETKVLSNEKWAKELYEQFKDLVQEEIDNRGSYVLNDAVSIIEVEEDALRYAGDQWVIKFRMKDEDIVQMFLHGVTERKQIKQQDYVTGTCKFHASYFSIVLTRFIEFSKTKGGEPKETPTVPLRNFVLIIDEINRANLPSVLGELIYALEYRGEKVESMYELDGDRTIALPPNLYIIGTMNTADRSVGHIDYAIRRRFAFVDLYPDSSIIKLPLAKELFNDIDNLFVEHTASDFEKNHVMLGHSYFLADNNQDLILKLKYEVLPILNEYIKDGIINKTEDSIKRLQDITNKINKPSE